MLKEVSEPPVIEKALSDYAEPRIAGANNNKMPPKVLVSSVANAAKSSSMSLANAAARLVKRVAGGTFVERLAAERDRVNDQKYRGRG